jgi:glycosyltransferase involved in cell wall biosynthesis
MPHISVVVPVYQGEKTTQELYIRLKASLETITKDYEILLIDDGSKDESWNVIAAIAANDNRVKGIQFVRNFGQHVAITAGLQRCDGDFVVIMDCDLQDPPEEIPRLYNKIQEGYHVVLANRKDRKDNWFKIACSYVFYKTLSYLSGKKYDSQVGCFRIISAQVVASYRRMNDQIRFFISLVEWMGFPTTSIDIQHSARLEGKSNYTFKKLCNLAMDIIISNSEKPLRMSIGFGFLVSSCAFIAALYIIARRIWFGVSVTGWSSIMIAIFFIGGVMILNLGLLGIYISKIFEQVKSRPLYIAFKEVGFSK